MNLQQVYKHYLGSGVYEEKNLNKDWNKKYLEKNIVLYEINLYYMINISYYYIYFSHSSGK